MDTPHEPDIRTSTAIFLHFLPGLAIAAAYLSFSYAFARVGLPRVSALLAAFVAVGMPLQLGIIHVLTRRLGRSVVHFRRAIPWWHHVFGAMLLIAFVFLLLQLPLGSISDYLATKVFSALPAAFTASADNDLANTSRTVLLSALLLQLLIDGVVNPLVEERYFRGFLLHQLVRWRWAAPVANTAFFALAHFWQPYNYVSIFVYVLPLTLFTWNRKNYYAQAFVHCFANSLGATLALVSFFRGA